MTKSRFKEAQTTTPCQHCGQLQVELEHNPNNNGLLVRCRHCGSKSPWTPNGQLLYLKQNETRRKREPLPHGVTLDSVWAQWGDVCFMCSAPREFLVRVGIGRQVHHVLPYATHGHQGPLVPICVQCHATATDRQRLHWFWRNRVEGAKPKAVAAAPAMSASSMLRSLFDVA